MDMGREHSEVLWRRRAVTATSGGELTLSVSYNVSSDAEIEDHLQTQVMKGANRRLLPFLECAHVKLWKKKSIGKNEKKVYIVPKHLDEKVAALHLGKLGARLTKFNKDQSDYISIPIEGPYKPAHYSWEERNGFFKCWAQNQMGLRIIRFLSIGLELVLHGVQVSGLNLWI